LQFGLLDLNETVSQILFEPGMVSFSLFYYWTKKKQQNGRKKRKPQNGTFEGKI
jgi:hypothetical protein